MKISHLQENLTPSSAPSASVPGPKFGRSDEMLESGASTTTAGVMSTGTPTNMGVQRRSKKGSDLLKGIKTSEKYANSKKAGISEDAINEDDLSEEQLNAKQKREELFKRAKDRQIGKKPIPREIMAKEQAMEEGDEQIDGMAQGEIREIIKNAIHIKNQLDKGVSLDGWMYSYVTTSNDHLNSVAEQINNPHIDEQDMIEGAKVDRMVKHVKSSEKKLGHSDKEAENIAWATANKRGMLNNKNKKGVAENDTHQIKGNELIEYLMKRFDMTREQAIELLKKKGLAEESKGLWANIHAKRERIKHGSGEHMRKPGSKGAPTADALRKSAK